jgi:sterol desaturase/sphingolipid hydroxylase (fatty acid hydroxylase superfamily)
MTLFSLEHSKFGYVVDFAFYTGLILVLGTWVIWIVPRAHLSSVLLAGMAGMWSWSLIEYLLHRFVLHGVQPFNDWHRAHHERPRALICTPTVLSAGLIAVLVFLPAWLIGDLWHACAFTVGVLVGYQAYAITHHAVHHWRAESAWLAQRKHWHAMHHRRGLRTVCYGVTSGFWDRVFRSN